MTAQTPSKHCVCVFHCCTCIFQATAFLITSAQTQQHSWGTQLLSNTQFRAAIEHRDVQTWQQWDGVRWWRLFLTLWPGAQSLGETAQDAELPPWSESCPDIAVYIHPPKCINPLELLWNSTTKNLNSCEAIVSSFRWILVSSSSLPC